MENIRGYYVLSPRYDCHHHQYSAFVSAHISTFISGHSRTKMSSLSNVLDSIASCSSSDEETGSSYSDDDDDQNDPQHPKYHSGNYSHRVWNYGEPTTATSNVAKNKNAHDEIMERERLLQEEYEFHVYKLKRENERLGRQLRLFVLVTVAFILAGALAFAFVVCIRMLLSSS